MKEHFKSVKKPEFFVYEWREDGGIRLTVQPAWVTIENPNLDSMLKGIREHRPWENEGEYKPIFRLNMGRNEIARTSRRAIGNVIFCSEETWTAVIKDPLLRSTQSIKHIPYGLKRGEALIAYSQMQMYPDHPYVVDGPFAWVEETKQLHLHPHWPKYFCRINLEKPNANQSR